LKHQLSHVLWLGGATDTGKTTIAELIAERQGLQSYHYDRHDLPQVEILAQTMPRYRAFLDASLEERWVHPEPEELFRFVWEGFRHRFPLVIQDLLALPKGVMVLVEGFGLTPELVSPVITTNRQAVWLVPTEEFKRVSMERRGKPSFRDQVSDPVRATRNVLRRDMMLAERVREQAQSQSLTVYEVDGSRSIDEMVALIESHFEPFLFGA
jgi:2-phosphoglycerate kinase